MSYCNAKGSNSLHYTLAGTKTVCGLPVRRLFGPIDAIGDRRLCGDCQEGFGYAP